MRLRSTGRTASSPRRISNALRDDEATVEICSTGTDGAAATARISKRIGRGVSSYVSTRLRGLIHGDDAAILEAKARRRLDQIPSHCLVSVGHDVASGLLVPAVGPQCAAGAGGAGNALDPTSLRDCLHTLLQVWVDRWGPNPQPLRPNVIFILDDDQRWDTTDGTHSPTGAFIMPRTRAELGDHGIEFTQALMTTPLCCPSRASILRGQFAHRTGVCKNGGSNGGADDFDDTSCLLVWLQSAGYRTSLIGKYLNGYAALWDPSTEPPYVPPGWTVWQGLRQVSYFNEIFVEPDGMGGYHDVTYGNAESDYLTDVKPTSTRSASTSADNGWQWGEHRFRAKNKPYEESIRSPMFVYYPKLAPLPRTDSRFALNVDLAPTFAELAGAGVPIVESGTSLVRVLDGRISSPRAGRTPTRGRRCARRSGSTPSSR
jgi:hypothetical protein